MTGKMALLAVVVMGTFITALSIDPQFDTLFSNVTVIRGEMATLPCTIDSLGKFKVAWLDSDSLPLTYEDRRVIDDTRFAIERPLVREWNLQIRDTHVDDQGNYLCSVNTDPIRNKVVRLVVHVPAEIAAAESCKDVTAVEGDDATLQCHVTGSPAPTVLWYRKSVLVGDGEKLRVDNVSRYEADSYLCVADNGVGQAPARCHASLTVQFGPEIIMPNRRIWQSVGRETILECTITALPQAISYWQKDGRRITNTLRPTVTAAAAAAGSDRSKTGSSAVPKYRIEAYHEGDHTLTLNLRLQITDKSDFGEYVCVASNARGSDIGSVQLSEYVSSVQRIRVVGRSDTATDIHSRPHQSVADDERTAWLSVKKTATAQHLRKLGRCMAASHMTVSRWLLLSVTAVVAMRLFLFSGQIRIHF